MNKEYGLKRKGAMRYSIQKLLRKKNPDRGKAKVWMGGGGWVLEGGGWGA